MAINKMTDWTPFIDQYGLPVGRYEDGRIDVHDSAQRIGMIMTAYLSLGSLPSELTPVMSSKSIGLYEVFEGILNRHFKSLMPTTDMTRDNERPYIQGLMLLGRISCNLIISRINKKRQYRNWTNWYQSGDVMGPSPYADYIRYSGDFSLKNKLLILLGDIDLLASSLIQIFKSWLDYDNVDMTLNIYNTMEFNRLTYETILNKITRFIFSKLVYKGVQYQFNCYFEYDPKTPQYSYGPPINELVKPIIEKYYS